MPLPTPEDLVSFLAASKTPQTKREIVRAFSIKGEERIALKAILRDLEKTGAIVKVSGAFSIPDSLPSVAIIEVVEIDIDGDTIARPVDWPSEKQNDIPRIEIVPDGKGHSPLKVGDRVLASLRKFTDRLYEGKVIRRLDDKRGRVLGLVVRQKNTFLLQPTDKKAKYDFEIAQADLNNATAGDLAVGEIQPSRGLQRKKVRIVNVIGREDDPKAISLIALHEAGMHEDFLDKVLKETKGLKVPSLDGREDLRDIPLVTIDGADARDFDDAVFAEKDGDGYHIIVAIADVAYYVRPGTELDREAYRRGNSTYFPDRVVPMLPEALSNDLCSLRPKEDRACMAFHLWIDDQGQLKRHKIVRGLMRSLARLTYEQVQDARDGRPDDLTGMIMNTVIDPLYDAFAVLDAARVQRGALELDIKERKIIIDAKGNMTGVANRERYDSHKLIEEFMILANVAAAQSLENRKAPCVYRVHDRPSAEKLDSARDFLDTFGLALPKGQVIKPMQINAILRRAAEMEYSHLISEVVLRCQSQAVYSTENLGHFGLALSRYAHFTSPIRRYSDLLVHRSLITAYGLGHGGFGDRDVALLEEQCEHISQTERTSMEAERSAVDRFTASWLSERIGTQFNARINGVTRFGLFVTLEENGADGLIPIRTLPQDFYVHDEQQHALIGRRHGRVYRLGAKVDVRLKEADRLTGSSIFELANDFSADLPGFKARISQGIGDGGGRGGRRDGGKNRKPYKKKPGDKYKKKGKRTRP